MAKVSRFATTRISASLIADYRKNDDVKDSFYLDGRLARKREQNSADVTNTGESRGFFYSIFANNFADMSEDSVMASTLNKMTETVKLSTNKIDDEINDLADCAVEVGGRATIAREGIRQAYFAGIILKEAEIAAVTRGGACSFLYRNNALYPLTTCDTELANADYHGNSVEHMTDFVAGVAGTIRYSNIAQVQAQDILIICNKEVFDAVGQRQMIKLLYENEDTGEAASEIIDYAREKNTKDSLQILLAKVEEVIPADRTGRLNIGLFQNQNNALSQETTRYQPVNSLNENDKTEPVIPKIKEETGEDAFTFESDRHMKPSTEHDKKPILSKPAEDLADDPFNPLSQKNTADFTKNEKDEESVKNFNHLKAMDLSDLEEQEIISNVDEQAQVADTAEDMDDVPVFEPVVPLKRQRQESFAAERRYTDEDFNEVIDDSYEEASEWPDDDYDAAYDEEDYEDDYYTETKPSNVKRNILYVILILICLVCVYALMRMFLFKDNSDKTKETESVSSQQITVNQTDESDIRTPVKNPATEPSKAQDSTEPNESGNESEKETESQKGGLKAGDTGTVNIEVLNIRSEPNQEAGLMGQLVEGSKVNILEVDAATAGWYKIQTSEGIQGYVAAEYID